jgi:hypothetical protein
MSTKSNGSNKRRHGRIKADTVSCQFGDIVDISSAGMRIRCRKKPENRVGDVVTLTVQGVNGPFTVKAKFAWSRRDGLFRHLAGFELLDVGERVRAELLAIARSAAISEVMSPNGQLTGATPLRLAHGAKLPARRLAS